ncbi:MAG: type IV secretory system conjugative DNA transfer family protein [Clostridia bacterium]|nr:type IV secretory system conjugative DNA transfer family protein [Clostridia bacterium]
MDKKKKPYLKILFVGLGAAALLIACALILTVVQRASFAAVFHGWILYIMWISLILLGGLFLLIDYRVRGSKRVLKVNVDLEDSHFMSKKEIERNDGYTMVKFSKLSEVADGIPIHAEMRKGDIDVVLKQPIHTLAIGATGTGKTTAFVSPTIEILARTKTKPSMVITDPKGELYGKHAATLKREGYNVSIIDLADIYRSTKWNPFNDIWNKTDKMQFEKVVQRAGKYYYDDVEYLTEKEANAARAQRGIELKDEIYLDLQDLIYTMCPIESKNDPGWQRGARDLLFALSLAFWEDVRDGYMPREKFNLYNLYKNVMDYAKGECTELLEYFETRDQTSRAPGLSNQVLVSQDRTLTSYLGDVNSYLNWMADGGIAALTSGNELEFSEFDEAPNALFLKIPDERTNRHRLVTLFITQMYKALVEKARKNEKRGRTKTEGGELLRSVYFIMDEFGNLPKLYNIDKIVTVGRSRHIYMIPVIQDFNQLDNIYGKEVAATVRSNCNVQIFIGSNDRATRETFSDMCGKKKTKQVSFSENKDMSVSTSATSVPLIYPSELEHLNDPSNGISGNAIISCLNNYPIRAKITPLYEAKEIYKLEKSSTMAREFINFDEVKNHYDIVKITAFLKNDAECMQLAEIEETIKSEETEQDEKGDAAMDAAKQAERDKEIAVGTKIQVLRGKIPSDTFTALQIADFARKVRILEEIIENAMQSYNYFIAAECTKIKQFIKSTCIDANAQTNMKVAN